VGVVMTARYVSSFLVAWLRAKLRVEYVRDLQTRAFDRALDAEVAYFDEQGSDTVLNAIVTQAEYAGRVIERIVTLVEQGLLSLIYLGIAIVLAPRFTLGTVVALGGFLYVARSAVESGYDVGDRVATANERVQSVVQSGTQGIRDVKLFGLTAELRAEFRDAVDRHATSFIALQRNSAAMDNFYQLASALVVFVLIYAALRFSGLSLAGLGVFLFAMFRLSPRVSNLNDTVYQLEGDLPHLVRTQRFIRELEGYSEPEGGAEPVPDPVERVSLENVSFAYERGEQVLEEVSFSVERGEFVAFVGPSGAGKSTIATLLARLYQPDAGTVRANGTSIDRVPVAAWRSRVSVVRQNPHVFDETLRYNITVGRRGVPEERLRRVCEIAQVTEFLAELPDGYETVLGDDGVKLSGGQRQRVALARALLKEADLLVLDEATSDLDSGIESRVQEGIEGMDRDVAMVAIAHRLSTVVNADRIHVVEDGQIKEAGRHDELVERGGTYADLYVVQSER